LQVDAVLNNTVTKNIWKFTSGRTFNWSRALIQLPDDQEEITLVYTVIQLIHNTGVYPSPYLALDDFSIQPGVCPAYGISLQSLSETFCGKIFGIFYFIMNALSNIISKI